MVPSNIPSCWRHSGLCDQRSISLTPRFINLTAPLRLNRTCYQKNTVFFHAGSRKVYQEKRLPKQVDRTGVGNASQSSPLPGALALQRRPGHVHVSGLPSCALFVQAPHHWVCHATTQHAFRCRELHPVRLIQRYFWKPHEVYLICHHQEFKTRTRCDSLPVNFLRPGR